jgi:hypothetical protein
MSLLSKDLSFIVSQNSVRMMRAVVTCLGEIIGTRV